MGFKANTNLKDQTSHPIDFGLKDEKVYPDSSRNRTFRSHSDSSAINFYLREIGRIPLLDRADEVELANRIKTGDRDARDLMIKSNLRLVVKIAFNYKNFGLPIWDLIGEGNIGLIKAVERFDPTKGGKLSTYAAWWIKQSIKRALANQSKTIRLPTHLIGKISEIRRTTSALTEELGRNPTDEEIAYSLEVSAARIAHLKSVSIRPASLNSPINGEEGSSEFGDLVGDEKALSPFQTLAAKSLQNDLKESIETLSDREAQIIRLRFGLGDYSPSTLEEVGNRFNITRERVRQLQNVALSRIRRIMHEQGRTKSSEEVRENEIRKMRHQVIKEYGENAS